MLTRLGPLERQMLEAVWARGDGTVRELIDHASLHMAYTTAMTTLTRLYEKQLLTRTVEGRAFRYKARFTKKELQRAEAGELIRQLLRSASSVKLPLSYLVEAVTEHDFQLLEDLQKLLDEKRRHLGKQD
jgi:predicted transcriptional regulator